MDAAPLRQSFTSEGDCGRQRADSRPATGAWGEWGTEVTVQLIESATFVVAISVASSSTTRRFLAYPGRGSQCAVPVVGRKGSPIA